MYGEIIKANYITHDQIWATMVMLIVVGFMLEYVFTAHDEYNKKNK